MKKTLSMLLALVMVLALCPVFASAEAAYTESPFLAAKVEAGELPPVADRLPTNPQVVEVAEIGIYGGVWRQAVTSGTFNHAQSHVTGHLNYNGIIWNLDKTEITTSWLSDFTYNEDYTEFTFTLRDGLKWSDGDDVTTEDVAFWYNDVILNTELSPTNNYYGDCTFTVVDDLTWTFTFAESKPLYPVWWASTDNSRFMLPSHYMKQFHASYAEDIDAVLSAEGFDDWTLMFEDKMNDQKNKDLPVMGPWVMTADPAETNTITYERNPYFWAVDANGQQLPYIDECVISIVESTDLVNMKVIGGEVDVQVACVQESFSNYPLFAQYAEEMNYHIEVSEFNEPNAMNFHFNVTSNDPVKAPYLCNPEFHKAMSLGLDRETIIATFYTVGPYSSKIAQTSPLEASPYYDETLATQYTEFDAATANAMLDELGMTQYDDDGYRMTANGEVFDLVILCPNYDAQWIEVAEMVASQWRENLKVNVNAQQVDPSLWGERTQANDFDITNLTGSNGVLMLTAGSISDWTGDTGYGWGVRCMPGSFIDDDSTINADAKAYWPMDDIDRLKEVGTAIRTETDPAKVTEYWAEITGIWAENLFSIGIGRRLPAINIIKNYMHNVSYLDQDWGYGFCGNSRSDTYWMDADAQ